MGVVRFKGQKYVYDRRGFLLRLFSRPRNVKAPAKTRRAVRSDMGQAAKRAFFGNRRMSRLEKYEDLLETSRQTRRPTKKNFAWWRKDIRNRDLKGVDTANEGLASTLLPRRKTMYEDLASSYSKGFGDVSVFKSRDKGFIESIKDEIESEWRY